jgi:MFS family permease
MLQRIIAIFALFISFVILCFGNSLQSVLLPARAELEHFSNFTIGVMMSGYYTGFIVGTFICPWLISRVGHVRVFAAASAGASAVMLTHALLPVPLVWIVLRIIYGLCMVHLFTVMESWLNSIGTKDNRAKILSIYMISNFVSSALGQMLFFIAPAQGFQLFSISAALLSLALFPLMLSRIDAPAYMQTPESFGVKEMIRISPLGVMGALFAGLMAGAYWGLAAVYILEIGFPQNDVAWFMAASLTGGLFAQWPLGVLSDRINRRYAIILSLLLICIASVMIGMMALWADPQQVFGSAWLIGWSLVFGAGFHPFYSLCMAHANDFVAEGNFVRASASLQRTQSIGAVAGPMIAGGLMYVFGKKMLFFYIAFLVTVFMLFTIYRMIMGRIPFLSKPYKILVDNGVVTVPAHANLRQ